VTATPEQTLIDLLGLQPRERVLDAGCGLGRWTAELDATGARVTGIDVHAPLLEQARISSPHAEFHAADLLTWKPAEPFDAIYAFATLHWVRPPDAAARALYGLLKPAGRLAAAFGGLSAAARELPACYRPEPDEYARVLGDAGFAILEMRRAGNRFLVLARRTE